MRISQIADVHIIANTGAICRKIIITKNFDGIVPPHSRSQDQGDQMCFGLMHFSQFATWIGPCRVEVTQHNVPNSVPSFCIAQHLLNNKLRIAIWIDGPLWMGFGQGETRRDAVNCARTRKYNALAAGADTSLEQVRGATDVVSIVVERLGG